MSYSTGEQFPRDPLAGSVGQAGATGAGEVGYGQTGGSSSTKDVAKDQAAQVGQDAMQSGQHVAGVAKEQAGTVAHETGRQAKDLLATGRSEVSSQISSQQQRAAGGLRALGEELRDLAEGRGGSGLATDLAHQASQRVSSVASWLGDREPADLLQEVQAFARRRPGTFLAVAAGVGLLAGRLTRGIAAAGHEGAQHSGTAQAGVGAGYPAATTYTGTAAYPAETSYASGETTGTVYPTGTPAYGTDPLDATDPLGQPSGRVLP
jgi:hypothetical protein